MGYSSSSFDSWFWCTVIVDNHHPLSIPVVLVSKSEVWLFVEGFDCERGYKVRDCWFGLSCDSVVFRHRDASIDFWLWGNSLHQKEWRSGFSSSIWVMAHRIDFRQCVLIHEQRKTVCILFDAVKENSGASEDEWVNGVLKVGFELGWRVHFHTKWLLLFIGSIWLGRSCWDGDHYVQVGGWLLAELGHTRYITQIHVPMCTNYTYYLLNISSSFEIVWKS